MMTKAIRHLSAAILISLLTMESQAQFAGIQHRLNVGQSMVIAPDSEATRFAVGDDNVAAVEILSPVEFLLVGKRIGKTNVIIWFVDGGREERVVIVEPDLGPLRERLALIDQDIRVESSGEDEIVLSGSVATYEDLRTVLRLTSDYMHGAEIPKPQNVSIVKPTGDGQQDAPMALQIESDKSSRSRVRNLLVVRSVPQQTLLDRLQAEAAKYSDDVSVRQLSRSAYPDDAQDVFVVEGTIASQGAYTQMLSVLDRILGGSGKFSAVTDSSGAFFEKLSSGQSEQAASNMGGSISGLGTGSGSTLKNNLEANPGRASIVKSDNERLVSFVKVLDFPQVVVAVRILEINRDKVKDVGVNWQLAIGGDGDFVPPATFPGGILPTAIGANAIEETLLPSDRNVSTVTDGLFVNSLTIVEDSFVLNNTLHLLEGKGYLRTLSEPNLVTLSGETATFLVGGQFPIKQVGSTNETVIQDTSFLEFGIRLSVRPVVAEDGMITLDISPQISSVAEVTNSGDPVLDITSLDTSVKLQDGEGIILGGLILNDERERVSQVPWLGDIPYIGRLFQRKTRSNGERELALILLPKIANAAPRENFALKPPPLDYEVRPGTYVEPELGKLPELPKFINTNVGTGERITINVEELPEFAPVEGGNQPEMIEPSTDSGDGNSASSGSGQAGPADGDVILVVPTESNP